MKRFECVSLGFSRGAEKPVLEDVSFSVEKGRILAVLGANGAGKTTLLSLCCGRLKPDSGSVVIDGQDIGSIGIRALARKIAFLPQIERLPFNYSVLEFVLMGRAPHVGALSQPGGRDIEISRQSLESLGLARLAGNSAARISGGEFQLARIARCLAQEAEILLMDEPTSLLDPANARRVACVLSELAGGGRTIILTTHDMALASAVADGALLLHDRRVIRNGRPREVLEETALERAYGVEFRSAPLPTAYPRSAEANRK